MKETEGALHGFTGWLKLLAPPIFGMLGGVLILLLASGAGHGGWFSLMEPYDRLLFRWIGQDRSPMRTAVALWLDFLGSAKGEYLILLVSLPVLIFRLKRFREAVLWSVSLTGAWWLNHVLKELFRRSRPDWEHLADTTGFSFPSGHAMVSLVFYGMLAYGLERSGPNRSRPVIWTVRIGIGGLVLAIGLSRVYLGVHYASDVTAGFAAGAVWLYACLWPLRRQRTDRSGLLFK